MAKLGKASAPKKVTRRNIFVALGLLALILVGGVLAARSYSAGETTVSALAEETHFHGIAVDPSDGSRLYLATHHGFYVVTPDGLARRVSDARDDYMGFTPHPSDPKVLYASGHPAGGGNLGFMHSTDGGRSWTKLSNGSDDPVDFHQMDVSKADPKVIYGVYGSLQKSLDGGRTWARVGPAPEGTIAIAGSSTNAETIYAATQKGLLVSADGGRSWKPAHLLQRTATMVHATSNRMIYAFIVGIGLVRASEPRLDWQTVGNDFGGAVVLHLAVAAPDGGAMFAVVFDPESRSQSLRMSRDGGRKWGPLGAK